MHERKRKGIKKGNVKQKKFFLIFIFYCINGEKKGGGVDVWGKGELYKGCHGFVF